MLSACWQIVPQMLNRPAGCPETTLLLFKDKQQRTPRGGQIECAVAILMLHTANTHFSPAFLCVFPGPVGRAWMHGLLQSHKVPDVVWLQSQFSFSLRLRHSTQQSTVDHSALSWWAAASCFSGVCSVANGELVLDKKAGWGRKQPPTEQLFTGLAMVTLYVASVCCSYVFERFMKICLHEQISRHLDVLVEFVFTVNIIF